MEFIDHHRDRFGAWPICRMLTKHGVKIAPTGYYAFKKRPPSMCAMRDAELVIEIERVFWDLDLGRGISGVRKIWRLLHRQCITVARCTVERLMRQQGLRGIRRGKQFVTTRPDAAAPRADRPNELWVVDFTYLATWAGMAFTAFVTDVFSRHIMGWRTMSPRPVESGLVRAISLSVSRHDPWGKAPASCSETGALPIIVTRHVTPGEAKVPL